jgi:hypothetical protein
VTPGQARAALSRQDWLVIAGYFDPLTASVAEQLEKLITTHPARNVLAVVLDASQTLLTAEARSVLVAALRLVQVVTVMAEEELSRSIPQDPRIRFCFDRETERRNAADFFRLVSVKEQLVTQNLAHADKTRS